MKLVAQTETPFPNPISLMIMMNKREKTKICSSPTNIDVFLEDLHGPFMKLGNYLTGLITEFKLGTISNKLLPKGPENRTNLEKNPRLCT